MGTTKAQIILDIEYDLPPSRYNKIEIQKILAIMCHEISRDKLHSWSDVDILSYKYKINLNPYYNKQKTDYKTTNNINKQEND